MDTESPRWDEWEEQFTRLAEQAEPVSATPTLKNSQHYLCLYGDNGLSPEEEFAELKQMEQRASQLHKVEIDTGYWLDTVLFVP